MIMSPRQDIILQVIESEQICFFLFSSGNVTILFMNVADSLLDGCQPHILQHIFANDKYCSAIRISLLQILVSLS